MNEFTVRYECGENDHLLAVLSPLLQLHRQFCLFCPRLASKNVTVREI